MKGKVGKTVRILFLALLIFSIFGVREAKAMLSYMDGRLLLKGSMDEWMILRTNIPDTEQDWHHSNISLALATVRFETFYTIAKSSQFQLNLQSILRYYYEQTSVLDVGVHDALGPEERNQFQYPTFRHDDPVNEFYFDAISGPWIFRVGKQIVCWGETALQRTTDVLNPMDLRYSVPGITPFEDLKLGLYMLRTFYQTNLPGNLLWEAIFVPTDHQMFRLPPGGTGWGPAFLNKDIPNSLGNGLFPMLQETWKEDAPSRRSLSDRQWAIRLRGSTIGVDWTLQYLDWMDFLPVGRPNQVNQQTFAYFYSGGKIGDFRVADRLWEYKRSQYVGATGQFSEPRLLKATIRLELAYNIGANFNTDNYWGKSVHVPAFKDKNGNIVAATDATQTALLTGITKRDTFGYGLAIDRPIMWNWLLKYTSGQKLDAQVQLFQDWILEHSHDLVVSNRGRGDKSSTSITCMLQQALFHQEVMVTWSESYNCTGKGYNVIDLFYAPGDHWRYDAGFYSAWTSVRYFHGTSYEGSSYADKQMVYFRLKYEW